MKHKRTQKMITKQNDNIVVSLGVIISFLTLVAAGSRLMGWVDWSWLEITSVYLICNLIASIIVILAIIGYTTNPYLFDARKIAFLIVSLIGGVTWAATVFMTSLRLDGHINWSWWIILSPMWAQLVLFIMGIYVGVKRGIAQYNEKH